MSETTIDEAAPPSEAPEPARPARQRGKAVAEWTVLVVAAVLIAIVVRTYVFQVFYIPSESMVPTLEINDRVLVSKLSYEIGDPARGDIVVFEAPKEAETGDIKDLVKRVVGLPGETIEGRNGRIYIDGRLLDETYLPEGITSKDFNRCTVEQVGASCPGEGFHVPPNSYFMLGDNRLSSRDSTVFGPITRESMVGKMFLVIWPLDRISVPGWLLVVGAGVLVLVVLGWVLLGRRRDVA